jgi:hypothetical protein
MAKNSAPDPRFDPRFQRGYEGPEPPAPSTPALPSPVGSSPSSPAPASAPEIQREPTARAVQEPGGSPESSAASDGDPSWAPPRRNPFALALLIAGLAMIAVGGWLVWTVVTASSFPDGYDRAAQAFSLVQQQLTPPLMIAGFLGVVGWLVLGALGASTRKRE